MNDVVFIEPQAVKRSTAARMLDCGQTKVYELARAGKLETILLGADVRITVASIKNFVANGGERR